MVDAGLPPPVSSQDPFHPETDTWKAELWVDKKLIFKRALPRLESQLLSSNCKARTPVTMAPPKFMGLSGQPLSLAVSAVATTGFLLFGYDQG